MLCARCGAPSSEGLCSYHHEYEHDTTWAKANRIWCDFFHRGVEPPRPPEPDRNDDLWSHVA